MKTKAQVMKEMGDKVKEAIEYINNLNIDQLEKDYIAYDIGSLLVMAMRLEDAVDCN